MQLPLEDTLLTVAQQREDLFCRSRSQRTVTNFDLQVVLFGGYGVGYTGKKGA